MPAAGPAPTDQLSMNVFASGPIKGIVTIQSGAPGRVRYALQGLPSTGKLRVVASDRLCGQAHTGASKVLGWGLGASNPTRNATAQFMVEISGVNAGTMGPFLTTSLKALVLGMAGVAFASLALRLIDQHRACSQPNHWTR